MFLNTGAWFCPNKHRSLVFYKGLNNNQGRVAISERQICDNKDSGIPPEPGFS